MSKPVVSGRLKKKLHPVDVDPGLVLAVCDMGPSAPRLLTALQSGDHLPHAVGNERQFWRVLFNDRLG